MRHVWRIPIVPRIFFVLLGAAIAGAGLVAIAYRPWNPEAFVGLALVAIGIWLPAGVFRVQIILDEERFAFRQQFRSADVARSSIIGRRRRGNALLLERVDENPLVLHTGFIPRDGPIAEWFRSLDDFDWRDGAPIRTELTLRFGAAAHPRARQTARNLTWLSVLLTVAAFFVPRGSVAFICVIMLLEIALLLLLATRAGLYGISSPRGNLGFAVMLNSLTAAGVVLSRYGMELLPGAGVPLLVFALTAAGVSCVALWRNPDLAAGKRHILACLGVSVIFAFGFSGGMLELNCALASTWRELNAHVLEVRPRDTSCAVTFQTPVSGPLRVQLRPGACSQLSPGQALPVRLYRGALGVPFIEAVSP
jgi:hypothetical protein